LPFTNGVVGEVTLVVGVSFASVMEASTEDAELTTAAVPILEVAAATIESVLHVAANPGYAGEIATETLLTSVVGDFAVVPILENDVRVAAVIVRVVDEEPARVAVEPPPRPAAAAAPAVPVPVPAAAFAPASLSPAPESGDAPVRGITLHEFQPLNGGQPGMEMARSLTLLNDVNMEVTAELGRRRLKVREIMALQPGSVIELDKTAGSPVDVLVNRALVWHGEVVVVDDEFGIRVSETVVDDI
jgi:flagellar motor switch protein FliN/FliY